MAFSQQLTCGLAFALYLLAACSFTASFIRRRPTFCGWGLRMILAGLLFHTLFIILRWSSSGHGPYLGQFDVFSSTAWVINFTFCAVTLRRKTLLNFGMLVLPGSLLLFGIGLISATANRVLPATFQSHWLTVHVLCAKLTLAVSLFALSSAVFFLLKEKRAATAGWQRLPDLQRLDALSFRFNGIAFVFWTLTVIAGALWAESSWGRYWGWDPIETWSLLTWLVFGLSLHLRRFYGLHGRKAAWLTIGCFLFIVCSILIVPFLTATNHTEYLQ